MGIKGQGGEPGPQESPCADEAGEFSRSRRWQKSCRERNGSSRNPRDLWRDAGSPPCVEGEFVPNSTPSSKGKVTPSHTWVTVATPRSHTAARPIHHPPSGKASVLKCKRNPVTSLFRAFRGLPREFRIKSNLLIVLGKRALPCMAPASPLPTRHLIPAKPGYTWSLSFCLSQFIQAALSSQLLTRELLLVLEAPDPVSLLSTRLSWPLPNPRQG